MVKLPDTDSETDFDRRSVLKGLGGATVGAAGFTGFASTAAAWGKGISWVAFCGEDCDPPDSNDDGSKIEHWIDYVCIEDGEITGLIYDRSLNDDCTVYFMSGGTIYEALEPEDDKAAGQVNQDAVSRSTDAHPSASSDPCACVPNEDDPRGPGPHCNQGDELPGVKFEVEESWKEKFPDWC